MDSETPVKRKVKIIEKSFWETGKLDLTPAEELDSGEQFQALERLAKRGLSPTVAFSGDNELDSRQLALANRLLNLEDKRSLREKLEEVQVTQQEFQAWLNTDKFAQFLHTRAERLFKNSNYEAYLGLTKALKSGSLDAIKFYFELTGVWSPRVTVDVNVNAVVVNIVEVIQRHVTDPNILAAIADDIEAVAINQQPMRELVRSSKHQKVINA